MPRLGLGRMATSPVFLSVLALFFLNLAVVIGGRIGPTFRRVQVKPRKEPGLRAWTGMKESLHAPLPEAWSVDHAVMTLTGYGYRVRRAGSKTVWGVRHRTAPLGFLGGGEISIMIWFVVVSMAVGFGLKGVFGVEI